MDFIETWSLWDQNARYPFFYKNRIIVSENPYHHNTLATTSLMPGLAALDKPFRCDVLSEHESRDR